MDKILEEIERGLKHNFYYFSVAICLTLPDICAAIESSTGETTRNAYIKWYERWLKPKYPEIEGFDMYRLRSGIVHQATLAPGGMSVDRIIFQVPNNRPIFHRNRSANNGGTMESALVLNAEVFCRDVMASVKMWLALNADNEVVLSNLPNILQLRPGGLPPHIVGVAVIA